MAYRKRAPGSRRRAGKRARKLARSLKSANLPQLLHDRYHVRPFDIA